MFEDLEEEIDLFARLARGKLVADPGYTAVQQLPGVGPILAAVPGSNPTPVTEQNVTALLRAAWEGSDPS